MVHARLGQIVLNCDIFKTLFRSARLGRVEGSASARSAETTTTSDAAGTQPAPVAMFLSRQKCGSRLFGSIVRSSLNIRIRWRPPSAHQAAAAAGRATGAPSYTGLVSRNRDPPRRSRAGAGEGQQWCKVIVVCEITSQVKSSQESSVAQ